MNGKSVWEPSEVTHTQGGETEVTQVVIEGVIENETVVQRLDVVKGWTQRVSTKSQFKPSPQICHHSINKLHSVSFF